MTCEECRYWQGTKYSQWAFCFRVIAALQPAFLRIKKYIDEDIWFYFTVPFDPHHVKYWNYNDEFMKLYIDVTRYLMLPKGVKRKVITEQDIWMDQFGNERMRKLKVCYFKTHKTFNCNFWEKK